ncbi:TPA_asm: hypothetical protein HUJ06_032030 [Nelumbo nucifera]|uniref:Uncharacterized protein n=1 Tax=Nelumbo nucifera TaxID=4432 RepID=A0A822Y351_NELNU|nr:TPA_asm: hypothetical protein HUJ06_026959 [Nelumbo nucifera]DAD25565.1 TPA_asm: hypothetical protein HUJ06_027029 [Nelumbo nucifera]DAD49309.1 TPA_asm: hypothetical protein HUJ06_032030 [Nelumbo nucifera]
MQNLNMNKGICFPSLSERERDRPSTPLFGMGNTNFTDNLK